MLAELLQGQPLPLIRTSVKNRGQLFYGSDAHGVYAESLSVSNPVCLKEFYPL